MSIYPQLQAFLDRLPEGLKSYPDALVKGAVLRQFFSGVTWRPERLPPELAAIATALPPASAWVPEVYCTALTLAYADETGGSEEQIVRWAYEQNRALLSQPLFKLMMVVVNPTMLLKGAASRHENLHRGGITLVALPRAERAWDMTMSFRPHLVPPLMVRCYATGYQAAMELARAKGVDVQVAECADDHALIRVSWTG